MAGGVTVISPNGGETLIMGDTYEISWTSSNPSEALSVELWKGSVIERHLSGSFQGSDSYEWTVDDDIDPGADYRILVKQTITGDPQDFSDSYFTIQASSGQTTEIPYIVPVAILIAIILSIGLFLGIRGKKLNV